MPTALLQRISLAAVGRGIHRLKIAGCIRPALGFGLNVIHFPPHGRRFPIRGSVHRIPVGVLAMRFRGFATDGLCIVPSFFNLLLRCHADLLERYLPIGRAHPAIRAKTALCHHHNAPDVYSQWFDIRLQ